MEIRKNDALLNTVNALHMSLQDSGYTVLDDQWCCRQTCDAYSRIYLVESGEGFLHTDKQDVTMRPGRMYLIPAGRAFGYHCGKTLSKLYFHVKLRKEDGSDLLQNCDEIMELPIPCEWMEILLTAYDGSSFQDAMVTKEYLYKIVNCFDDAFSIAQQSIFSRTAHVAETMLYIQYNLKADLKVEALARRRYISKAYLEKLFRREVGLSVGQYLDEQLMQTARWWLEQTNQSVSSISQTLGYRDPYYFSRRFKQLCGVTPLQYRRSRRK